MNSRSVQICPNRDFPPQTMKITTAETRIAGREKALFATIDETEYAFVLSKDIWLAQGITLPPDGWPFQLEQRELFLDLRDSTPETPSLAVEGITDRQIVGLVIRASRSSGLGPIPIPTEAEGQAAIKWMCKQQIE